MEEFSFKGYISSLGGINESSNDLVLIDVQEEYQNKADFKKYIKYAIDAYDNGKDIYWIIDDKSIRDYKMWLFDVIFDNDLRDFDPAVHEYYYKHGNKEESREEFMEQQKTYEIDDFIKNGSYIARVSGGYSDFIDDFGSGFTEEFLIELKKRKSLNKDIIPLLKKEWDIWVDDFFKEYNIRIEKEDLDEYYFDIPEGFEDFGDLPNNFELIGKQSQIIECLTYMKMLGKDYNNINRKYVFH